MTEAIYKILWVTIEDFVGSWEIYWEVNSLFPKKSTEENQEFIKRVLLYFLETELVVFYSSEWGNDETNAIELEKAKEYLNLKEFWIPPSLNQVCIKVGSTEKGERYYNDDLIDLNL